MKAACTAAQRGHIVTLVEKQNRLGGQLLLNRNIPGRSDFVTVARDLIQNLNVLDVTIILGTEVNMAFIEQMAPDVVVLATGARPFWPDIPGIESDNVVHAWDLLNGKVRVGNKVVVLGGNAVGVETALYLASQGTLSPEAFYFLTTHKAESVKTLSNLINKGNKDVTLVEMTPKIGQDLGVTTRWSVMAELKRFSVTIMKETKAVAITPEGLNVETPKGSCFLKADSIVIAAGSRSENSLADEIKHLVPKLYIIGDARKPRKALDAIHEGYMTGLEIGTNH